MKPFQTVTSVITPLDKANVDTDQIIPKQFLKLITKSGFGKFLFYNWRFDDEGKPNDNFILNKSDYKNSEILVAQENFGCGSSREHAVWALNDYGFKIILAPSFADIFYNNCFKNGVLPIELPQKIIEKLMNTTSPVEIDLESQTISTNTDQFHFDISSHRKNNLLEGLDEIGLTLQHESDISQYEEKSNVSSL